jgi:hypothetical protein
MNRVLLSLFCSLAANAPPRTWHVAPEELVGLPRESQLRTISQAAAKVGPGDTVVIHGGSYRETVTIGKSGTEELPIRFQAASGENVVVTGADAVREWRKEPGGANVYSAPWPHRFIGWNKSGTHPDDNHHKMIGRCEQVFIAGYPLLHVLERAAMSRGTFHVDLEGRRLYVCPRDGVELSKDAPLVEASARDVLWHVKGQHVHTRGLHFRYAANMAQHGAAIFEGDRGVVEDCSFESMNSSGATFAAGDLIVRRCLFRDNGQIGFGAARAHGLIFSECIVRENNVKGFDRGWEAGGNKLALCRNVVIEKSQFLNNHGNGIWFDIGNENPVVRNCLIADNDDAGIFYEISYGLHAHDNVIVGNGFRETPGSWGAGSGISLSSSPSCVIERNLIVGNREGFNFREQDRKTPRIDDDREVAIWNHDERITHNLLAFNRDAQVRGWFDTDDGRHWPATLQESSERRPGGLTLEKLSITVDHNLYSAHPWQPLFIWGVEWKRHKAYDRLDDVRSGLGLETGSQVVELTFANIHARDFRVPAESPALTLGCYPKGEIPGACRGILREP